MIQEKTKYVIQYISNDNGWGEIEFLRAFDTLEDAHEFVKKCGNESAYKSIEIFKEETKQIEKIK